MSALRILDPGLLAHVQDLGRFGHQRSGVPVSGVLDREAMRLANALVGNAAGEAVVEIRYLGPEIELEAESVRIALVGADVSATVRRGAESLTLGPDRTLTLRRGDRVKVGPLRGSTTACLAVAGGFDIAPVLGSRSTFAKSHFGGLRGRALEAGDRLPLSAPEGPGGPEQALARPFDLTPPRHVRVVLGPQDDHFTEEAVRAFLGAEWRVSKDADRMGLRLEGPALDHRDGYNIVSDGIVTGAIQVPGSRQPIVLLADRQTSGGYPKIAAVITADLPALGRLAPGATLRFEAVTAAEGARIARAREAELAAMIDAIGPWHPPGEIDEAALYRTELISPPVDPD